MVRAVVVHDAVQRENSAHFPPFGGPGDVVRQDLPLVHYDESISHIFELWDSKRAGIFVYFWALRLNEMPLLHNLSGK